VVLGVQAIGFGLCARAYGAYFITDRDELFHRARAHVSLEHGLLAAAVVSLEGLVLLAVVVAEWASSGFGALSEARVALLGATLVVVGAQVFFTSFMLSILGLRRRFDEP
jgi:hypothetical protein